MATLMLQAALGPGSIKIGPKVLFQVHSRAYAAGLLEGKALT